MYFDISIYLFNDLYIQSVYMYTDTVIYIYTCLAESFIRSFPSRLGDTLSSNGAKDIYIYMCILIYLSLSLYIYIYIFIYIYMPAWQKAS